MNNRTVVNANDIVSLKVMNNQDKDLGKVAAIMLHKVDGKVYMGKLGHLVASCKEATLVNG